MFYATFPAARVAVCNAAFQQSIYDLPSPVDCPTLHEATRPLEYDICNEPDISSTSVSFRGPTPGPTYPQLHFTYSEGLYPRQSFFPHQIQSSYYSPPRPVSFFLTFFWCNF